MNAYDAVVMTPIECAIIDLTNAMYHDECKGAITNDELRDALSSGQLMSKKWLLDKFSENVLFPKVVHQDQRRYVNTIVVGGWIGLLASALNHLDARIAADSLDIDPKSTMMAKHVLGPHFAMAYQGDMYDYDYTHYDVVVNTSSEHIPDVAAWSNQIAEGTIMVVQSNNARGVDGHVSCVDSCLELYESLEMTEVFFSGEIKFPMYTRFMVIGKK